MKALRVYFLMALVWVSVGLSSVACSDKDKGGPQACPQGQAMIGGGCSWDPSNPGNGGTYPPGGYAFIPNGDITNDSKFRDFNVRFFPDSSYSYCLYSYPFSCDEIQEKLQKINGTEYYVYLTSTSIGSYYNVGKIATTLRLNGTKFTYDGTNETIIEVYHYNPTKYVIAEVVLHSGLSASSTYYTLNFKDNSSWATIADGDMTKGQDY